MAEHRVGFSEKRIGDAGRHRVGTAVQIGIDQRELGIHGGGFAGNAQVAADLQRDSVRCDDVENFLGELVAAQVVFDGASDLIVVFGAQDLFIRGGVDPANVGSGNVAAFGVIFADLARERGGLIDYDENRAGLLAAEKRAAGRRAEEF